MGRSTVRMLRAEVAVAFPVIGFFFLLLGPPLLHADSDFSVPKPTDVLLPPPPSPTVAPSVVNVTVGRDLRDMIESVDLSIPVHHRHEEEWIPGKRPLNGMPFAYQYYLWRGPVRFRVDGDRLVTEFPDVRYRIRVRVKESNGSTRTAECGYGPDAHMRMGVEAASEVHWNDAWTLQTRTQFGSPDLRTPCRLDPIALDVTGMLNDWFIERLPSLATAIDQTFVKQAETKQRAAIIWGKFQEPMELRPGTWLVYRPEDPRAGSLTLDRDQTVRSIIRMTFDPMIVVGAKPRPDSSPLPPLKTGPAAEEGFHLAVPMLVPYDALNRQLAKEVVGQEIVGPVGASIRITGVRAYGSGDHLISEVTLSGGMNGTIYLQGKPVIAPDGHTLDFQNLDFTMETANVLAKFANRVIYDTIREKVRQNSRIEVRDRIETLRRQVERQMNRELAPGLWLEGAVTTLAPRGIYPVPDGIELQFAMDGTLHVNIQ